MFKRSNKSKGVVNSTRTINIELFKEKIKENSMVTFNGVTVREEAGKCYIGSVETGTFFAVDIHIGYAVKFLMEGRSAGQTKDLLLSEYDIDIDVKNLIVALLSKGFAVGILEDTNSRDSIEGRPDKYTVERSGRLPRLFLLIWLFVTTGAIITLLLHPRIFPMPRNFFWTRNMGLTITLSIIIFFSEGSIHESFHYFTAKYFGLPAKIGISTRLLMPVLQTEVPSLWAISKKNRQIVLSAGMMWDSLLFSSIIMFLYFSHLGGSVKNYLEFLSLILFLDIISQFSFYMRTDVYFMITNYLGCSNLYEDSINYIKYGIKSVFSNILPSDKIISDPSMRIEGKERKYVRIYSFFLLCAIPTLVFLTLFYSVPIVIGSISIAVMQLNLGISQGKASLLLLGLIPLIIMIIFFVVIPSSGILKWWKVRNNGKNEETVN